MPAISQKRWCWLVAILLAALTVAVFWQVVHCHFINFDDPTYITNNAHVRTGLSWANARWAFTSGEEYWIPVTRLYRMLECELFGLNPAWHHVNNVILHGINAVLLFFLLICMTGACAPSAMVAALFAIHPLHVESVAWVTELKDVLSAIFCFLALGAYVSYTRTRARKAYALMVAMFALSLMSKPMAVSFPLVLLLLDYWPLGRAQAMGWCKLVFEKWPLFAMAALCTLVTSRMLYGQERLMVSADLGWFEPWGNALIAYVAYMRKMLWSDNLSVYYPLRAGDVTFLKSALAGALLALVSLFALRRRKANPYLVTGWLWYLITLAPVIVQVGSQAMADRYTYVSLIGIFFALVWGICDLAHRARVPRAFLAALGAIVLMACMLVSMRQVDCWRDSATLFGHAVRVDADNALAHFNLATALVDEGKILDALRHFEMARKCMKVDANFLIHYGGALQKKGALKDAEKAFREALALDPRDARAHHNLGYVLRQQGREAEAVYAQRQAVLLDPAFAFAEYFNEANALCAEGRWEEAIAKYRQALAGNPGHVESYNNLGIAYASTKDWARAIAAYQQALAIDPYYVNARFNLALALKRAGRDQDALKAMRRVLEVNPRYEPALEALEKANE